jgi:hypothetical protein
MAMKQRHQLDTRGAFEFGNEAEETFFRLVEQLEGHTIERGTQEEDYKHIDFWVTFPDGLRVSVDVKAMKRVSAGDQKQQDAQVWVELRNVNGDYGWCFSDVDVIAFEFETAFFLVQRKTLAAWVIENVSTETVDLAHQAVCKVYQRKDRKDKLTLLQSYWIRALAQKGGGMLRKDGGGYDTKS